MRTTVLDVLRFAWQLLRIRKERNWARIGQILWNVNASYHLENRELIEALKKGRL